MKLASVSELKDGLSAHLELVRGGETVVVTDRRVPVAVLERIESGLLEDGESGLVAQGIVAPPRTSLAVGEFLALPRGECAGGLTAAMLEERAEGR